MSKNPLSEHEQKTLKIMTILAVITLTVLFVMQRIIFAMILGIVLVIAQKAYLSLKTNQAKKKK